MSTANKLPLTASTGHLLAILAFVVNRGDCGEADAHFWRAGQADGRRQLTMTRDGNLWPWANGGEHVLIRVEYRRGRRRKRSFA